MVEQGVNHTLAKHQGPLERELFSSLGSPYRKNEVPGAQSSGWHLEAQVLGSKLEPAQSDQAGLAKIFGPNSPGSRREDGKQAGALWVIVYSLQASERARTSTSNIFTMLGTEQPHRP